MGAVCSIVWRSFADSLYIFRIATSTPVIPADIDAMLSDLEHNRATFLRAVIHGVSKYLDDDEVDLFFQGVREKINCARLKSEMYGWQHG